MPKPKKPKKPTIEELNKARLNRKLLILCGGK